MTIKIGFNRQTAIIYLTMSCALYSNANAASEQFCERYARTSIVQNIQSTMYECGFKSLRWNSDFSGQKKWCKGVRQTIATSETKARTQALSKCGVGTSKSWATLPYEQKESYIQTAIRAASSNDVQTLKSLKQAGASITAPAMQGNDGTPLAYAIKSQAFDAVAYLLKFSSPNQSSNSGLSPLANLLYSKKINYKLLRYLLQHGASADYIGRPIEDSSLPLYIAVGKKDLRAVRELLHIGKADPNGSLDESLLIQALKLRHKAIILQLIYAGANVNQVGGAREGTKCNAFNASSYQKMPLDYALEMNDGAVIYTIRKRGGKTKRQCIAESKK
ncbi:MAG: ankyrin repeat domain-containing protein [Thiotrichaceae bacterium]|nr:ankyrin repeat domain-containing protein [Thiotrichaceae bacterium]